jgi:hypothetical protein
MVMGSISSPQTGYITRAIFLKKIGSGTNSDPKFCRRWGGISYIDARAKKFRNVVSACVILRKIFRNGVPARSVTKIPLNIMVFMAFYSLSRQSPVKCLKQVMVAYFNVLSNSSCRIIIPSALHNKCNWKESLNNVRKTMKNCLLKTWGKMYPIRIMKYKLKTDHGNRYKCI